MKAPDNLESANISAVIAFAQSLMRQHVAKGGDPAELFAAYVAVIFDRNPFVARSCLIGTDRWIASQPQ